MKVYTVILLLAVAVFVECGHTFIGTNVNRHLVYQKETKYPSYIFQKRIEYLNFTLPSFNGMIQGILAYDLTNSSGASANVTKGGIGYDFVNLRMKSERAKELHFDIYIYA